MIKLLLSNLLLCVICNFAFAISDDSEVDEAIKKPINEEVKALSNEDIFNNYKRSIKPVELKEGGESISIMRGTSRGVFSSGELNSKALDVKVREFDNNDPSELISQGYKASSVGQIEAALTLYKKALGKDIDNENVLFALASLYHKLSQTKEAKIYYKKLLMKNPNYSKALNNYIVLMGEESPGQALMELKEFERINPDFSPVQAQIGMIYARMSDYEQAEKYLVKAISLEPSVLNYRYNLAVIYDSGQKYPEAVSIYKQLLDASINGGNLPQSYHTIKSRMQYLQEKISLQRSN